MPFDRGSFTFAMFDIPAELPENLLDLFAAKKAGPLDAVTDEPQLGWVTGHHLLDTTINEESAQMGGSYYLTLRQAVRKMPASLLNAVCKREEQAYMRANELEYVSSKMKKQIREEAIEKHIQKMPPALSGIPMVLEPHERLLYVSGYVLPDGEGRTAAALPRTAAGTALQCDDGELPDPDHQRPPGCGAGDRARFPDVALVLQ